MLKEVEEGRGREDEAEEEGGEEPPRGAGSLSRSLCGEGGRDPSVTASPVIHAYFIEGQREQEQAQKRDSNQYQAVQI